MSHPFYLNVCGSTFRIKTNYFDELTFKKTNNYNRISFFSNKFSGFSITYSIDNKSYLLCVPGINSIILSVDNLIYKRIIFNGNKEQFYGQGYKLASFNHNKRKICSLNGKIIFTLDNLNICEICNFKRSYIFINMIKMNEYIGILSDIFNITRDMPILLYAIFVIDYQKTLQGPPP